MKRKLLLAYVLVFASFFIPLNTAKPSHGGAEIAHALPILTPLESHKQADFTTLEVVPITPEDYVRNEARKYGWDSGSEWDALSALLNKESGFNPLAVNSSTNATGMFQFLDSTWASYGCTRSFNPSVQAECGLKYIKSRYNSPSKALYFWVTVAPQHNGEHWY